MVVLTRLARYVGARVALVVAVVTLVLTGLYLGVDLVREAADMVGGYGMGDVAWFLLRTVPARIYDLFPFAALIGAMLALGALAARGELVAMRACGFDRLRIAFAAMLTAAVLGLAVMLLGELVAPRLELAARIDRERAMERELGAGDGPSLWIRDGESMVHAGLIAWRDDDRVTFGEVRIYVLDGPARFERIWHAATAGHLAGQWVLKDAVELDPATGRMIRHAGERALSSQIDADVFRALATRPRLLPIADIVRIQRHMEDNDQDAIEYRQAYWRRLLYPVNLLAMLFSGVALLFSAGRALPPAAGVFAGVSLGIGFIVVQRLVLGLAPILPVPFAITHLAPAVAFGAAGLWLLRR